MSLNLESSEQTNVKLLKTLKMLMTGVITFLSQLNHWLSSKRTEMLSKSNVAFCCFCCCTGFYKLFSNMLLA